ncbi:hypothetical protein NBRC116188_18680 [Oceaniserpentilla sp. 4NH20-0058]
MTGQILGAHPKAFLIDEFEGVYKFLDYYLDRQAFDTLSMNEIVNVSSKKYTDIRANFSKFSDIQSSIIVAKAPNITYEITDLLKRANNIKVVYPVRNPRSVVASMLKLKHIPMVENQTKRALKSKPLFTEFSRQIEKLESEKTSKLIKAAIIWNIKTSIYKAYQEGDLDTFVFKYEDLIVDFKATLELLTKHCGLEYDPASENYFEYLKGEGPGDTLRDRKIDPSSLDKWKTQLSEAQISELDFMTKRLSEQLGYSNI